MVIFKLMFLVLSFAAPRFTGERLQWFLIT